jgi:hypothetical protein
MAKCKIPGCTKEAGVNPKTGKMNAVCKEHFLETRKSTSRITSPGSRPRSNNPKKPKVAIKKPELFVLRGHTLTINYTGTTRHINVDRLTRAVKYNDDRTGTSGKKFHYVIDIKQGIESIGNVLFDTKAERDQQFAKLQALLSSVY